jgi:chromate transporter
MTLGIFLPAFLFSILFFRHLEVVIHNPALHHFLEGVTAGVVGLIAITAISLGAGAIQTLRAALIFAAALAVVYRWKGKLTIPAVIAGSGLAGWFAF